MMYVLAIAIVGSCTVDALEKLDRARAKLISNAVDQYSRSDSFT